MDTPARSRSPRRATPGLADGKGGTGKGEPGLADGKGKGEAQGKSKGEDLQGKGKGKGKTTTVADDETWGAWGSGS